MPVISLYLPGQQEPGTRSSPPANIVIQKLTLDPPKILVGQTSDVRVKVSNNGGMAGEYIVIVKLDGKIQKTQSVYLGPGESREVNLIICPKANGIYTVSAGPASEHLIVDPWVAPNIEENNYWWLLFISLGISVLLFAFFFRRRKNDSPDNTIDQSE